MHYAGFSGGGYYLYYALRILFRGWILFVLCTTQYFQGVDTICTMHYAVFSVGGYNLYYALCSIFRRWILFVLCSTQYFQEVDTICFMHYAVFLGDRYYLYYALRSIFRGWILLILCTTLYFRGANTIYTMHYAVFSGLYTSYSMQYAVFSRGGYKLYYALRSIFGEWILFTLSLCSMFWGWILSMLYPTQYFRRVDTISTMHYAVFSEGGYVLYYAVRSIFQGRILAILCTTQ